jgi:hypothetical protein
MTAALIGKGVGKCSSNRPVLASNHQIDVRNFIAFAYQSFADVHGHGGIPIGVEKRSEFRKSRDCEHERVANCNVSAIDRAPSSDRVADFSDESG